MDFAGISMPSWDDMELLTSPSRGGPHRRVRSDPTDVMQALRAERALWGGSEQALPSAPKRDLSPMESMSPAYKKHAPSLPDEAGDIAMPFQPKLFRTVSDPPPEPTAHAVPCDPDGTGSYAGDDDIDATGKSKKDVPMWTVEEDLLILQLVEKHGKRWSKIAQHLPGRTDNGVRNRWNRMERAQVLRQRRGPEAGYRCRRCGQPKRGHICAALTLGETPAGEELQQKAQALSKLSADRMRPTSAASEMSSIPTEPSVSAQSTPQMPYERAASPDLPPLHATAVVPPVPAAPFQPVPHNVAALLAAPRDPVPVAMPVAAPSFALPVPERQPSEHALDEAQLDDFLHELQLHELTASGGRTEQATLHAVAASLTGEPVGGAAAGLQSTGATLSAPAAMLSQASLHHLLATLTGPDAGLAAQHPHLAAF